MRLTLQPGGPTTCEDRGPFEVEAAACRQRLYRYAVSLTGSHADAEDLVQDTLLRGLQSWRSFRPGTRMAAWLRTILYHLFINQQRTRRELVGLEVLEGLAFAHGIEDGATVDPHRIVSRRILRDALEGAIDQLSPEHREAVRLGDVEGYSGLEVAQVVGVPVGTVKSRLFRARRLLQGTLQAPARELGYGLATAQ
ncbi:MAG: RNA polymerase sigma factor [Gemmatimonadota bacterium]|nr:RNA polymerase sigma factor [Gemmatimonadota bacterium]